MALYACEYIQNEYIGDGSTKLYSFTFEYSKQSEVTVSLRDPITKYFFPIDRSLFTFANPTTIEFSQAPVAEYSRTGVQVTNIRVSRTTDLSSMVASFYPGSAIRAQDLNDNFEQLRLAIVESACSIPQPIIDFLQDNYWDKNSETIRSTDAWIEDDLHVATTAAIGQLTTTPADLAKKWDKTTETVYSDDSWNSTNSKVASTAAINSFVVNTVNDKDIGVSKLIAGRRVVLDPPSGVGEVTISGERDPGEDASVKISDEAPTDNFEGDLWWNTNDGRLYVWYIDQDSSQWVDASPDSLATSYWDRDGTTLSPGEDGDSVDIGDGNIELNAADGSATFAGNLKLDGTGTQLDFVSGYGGYIECIKDSNSKFKISDDGTSFFSSNMEVLGSASFTGSDGEIYLTPSDSSTGGYYRQTLKNNASGIVWNIRNNAFLNKIYMTADGSATFAGDVSVGTNFSNTLDLFGNADETKYGVQVEAIGALVVGRVNDSCLILNQKGNAVAAPMARFLGNGGEAASISNDGTAFFAGNVSAPNINNTFAALLRLKAALLTPEQDVNQLRERLLEALENITEEVN